VPPAERSATVWYLQYAVSVPLVVVPSVLFVGYVALRVPLGQLIGPSATISVLHMAMSPAVRWAQLRGSRDGAAPDPRPILAVSALYAIAMCIILAHYAGRFGFVSPATARSFAIFSVFALPTGIWFSYQFLRKFRWPGF